MGIPGEFANPQFTAALDRVAAAAKAHGKAAGMLVRDASEVPAYLARGYGFLGHRLRFRAGHERGTEPAGGGAPGAGLSAGSRPGTAPAG